MTIETPANFHNTDDAPIPPPFDPTADAVTDRLMRRIFGNDPCPGEPEPDPAHVERLARRAKAAAREFQATHFPLTDGGTTE